MFFEKWIWEEIKFEDVREVEINWLFKNSAGLNSINLNVKEMTYLFSVITNFCDFDVSNNEG